MGKLDYEYASALAMILTMGKEGMFDKQFEVLQEIMGRAWEYEKSGFMEELICGFVKKKAEMIRNASKKEELNDIRKVPKPHYDGNKVCASSSYDTEEEELILWSQTSLKGPLTEAGFKRYTELFRRLLPEQAERIFAK